MHYQRSKKKKNWFGWVLVVLFFIMGTLLLSQYRAVVHFDAGTEILIKKGDTIAKFYSHQSNFAKAMTKLWIKNNASLVPKLQEGVYTLSGTYTKAELMNLIKQGPAQIEHLRLTLLEWWSIYDIDAELVRKGLISEWSYIQATQNQERIWELRLEFPFLAMLPQGRSLEGFLYPDTYFLAPQGNIIDQLIKAQLKAFNEKVWKSYRENFISFQPQGLALENYAALILASVIENEEKNDSNKPLIAGIFINRLKQGMRLDADVTLCYGLKVTYDACRAVIVPNLSDASNLYNTRQNFGLPPTPISSPSVATLAALFNFKQTQALFYLHDQQGEIHYGVTLEEHNQNKQNYL